MVIWARGSAIWNEATDSVTCFESEVARSVTDRATAVVRGATPFGGELPVDLMLRPQGGGGGGVRGRKNVFCQLADHVLSDACTPPLAPQSA